MSIKIIECENCDETIIEIGRCDFCGIEICEECNTIAWADDNDPETSMDWCGKCEVED